MLKLSRPLTGSFEVVFGVPVQGFKGSVKGSTRVPLRGADVLLVVGFRSMHLRQGLQVGIEL